MSDVIRLVWRGFSIVCLTSSNVYQVSHGHYLGAFINGFLISYVWWLNSRASGRSDHIRYSEIWYGTGAALGTVTGMTIAAWWYG